jgi:hypothetical protein
MERQNKILDIFLSFILFKKKKKKFILSYISIN